MKHLNTYKQLFEGKLTKDELIDKIKDFINRGTEESYSSGELLLDSSPQYAEYEAGGDEYIELIEHFYDDSVTCVKYGKDTELGEFEIGYEKLSIDLLEEILDGFETAEVYNEYVRKTLYWSAINHDFDSLVEYGKTVDHNILMNTKIDPDEFKMLLFTFP
jgi:hypothetical protein